MLRFYVDVLLINEARTLRLAKKLGSHAVAYAAIVGLRSWAVEHASGGDVSEVPDETIASACLWRGDVPTLVSALVPDFIGSDGKLVGWDDFAGKILSRLEWDRSRPRRSTGRSTGTSTGQSPGQSQGPSGGPSAAEERSKTEALDLRTETGSKPLRSRKPSGAWSQEACEDWETRFGAKTAAGGKIGSALKPLVEAHGWPNVRPAWQSYLRDTDGKHVSAARFRETYGQWAPLTSAPPKTDPGLVEVRRRIAEEKEKSRGEA